jgi:hypothetical protein
VLLKDGTVVIGAQPKQNKKNTQMICFHPPKDKLWFIISSLLLHSKILETPIHLYSPKVDLDIQIFQL